MRGGQVDPMQGLDLSHLLGGKEYVGEARLPDHPRIDRVIVSLKHPGELSDDERVTLQQMVAVAAEAALRA